MSAVANGSMVTVITEKLRNQSLEDVKVEPFPIPQPSVTGTWTFATSSTSAFQITGPPNWTLFLDTCDKWSQVNESGGSHAQKLDPPNIQPQPSQLCAHHKFLQMCSQCHSHHFYSQTPPTPPKKRHCRSLSIPGDGKTGKKWQPQASSIWRPVAQKPHLNNNKMLKNRNYPHWPPNSSSPQEHGGVGTPGMQSPAATGWFLSRSDDFPLIASPPESPVPRPASASSGYYDSSSFSSVNSMSKDYSPGCGSCVSTNHKQENLKIRSISLEEPISNPSTSSASRKSKDMESMPVIPLTPSSTPSSPKRQRVPRCRSQPCVLHDRKCGLKRRRDDERPTLDLLKMKETSYDRFTRRTKSVHFPYPSMKSSRSLASLFSEPPECFLGLNTIASSPLDSHLPTSLANSQSNTASSMNDTVTMTTTLDVQHRSGKPGKTHEPLSDSGCTDVNDTQDLAVFSDSEETSCACAGQEDEQMFEIEMNELDIDQIEKD